MENGALDAFYTPIFMKKKPPCMVPDGTGKTGRYRKDGETDLFAHNDHWDSQASGSEKNSEEREGCGADCLRRTSGEACGTGRWIPGLP